MLTLLETVYEDAVICCVENAVRDINFGFVAVLSNEVREMFLLQGFYYFGRSLGGFIVFQVEFQAYFVSTCALL